MKRFLRTVIVMSSHFVNAYNDEDCPLVEINCLRDFEGSLENYVVVTLDHSETPEKLRYVTCIDARINRWWSRLISQLCSDGTSGLPPRTYSMLFVRCWYIHTSWPIISAQSSKTFVCTLRNVIARYKDNDRVEGTYIEIVRVARYLFFDKIFAPLISHGALGIISHAGSQRQETLAANCVLFSDCLDSSQRQQQHPRRTSTSSSFMSLTSGRKSLHPFLRFPASPTT